MQRRDFLITALAVAGFSRLRSEGAQEPARDVSLERPVADTPHKGKVLLAVQAHSDDIPLMAAGTVAKLVKEGYTGYLLPRNQRRHGRCPRARYARHRGPARARE